MSFDPSDYNNSYNMDENMQPNNSGSKGMAIASMVLGF